MFSWAPLLSLDSGWVPLRCAPDPNPSTPPALMPHNGKHKQNLSRSPSSPAQYGLVIRSAPEKTKQRSSSLCCGEAVCGSVCVCLIAYATSKQTRRWEAQTNWETCNKSEIVWEGYQFADKCTEPVWLSSREPFASF